MANILAFDVYGTLIDTHGVVHKLSEFIGERANEFSQTWRNKQLEYSFRRGLMQLYAPFSACTAEALDFTCAFYNTQLSNMQRLELLESYHFLPAFRDAIIGLEKLQNKNFHCYAFSNGAKKDVETVLKHANLHGYFKDVISVEDVKSFKPNPGVYAHFLRSANTTASNAWLISSNSFDVIGAISSGMNAAWIKRSSTSILDPWGVEPTSTLESLENLASHIQNHTSS